MKTLLISHKADPDGISPIIFLKLIYVCSLNIDASLVHYAGSPKPWDDNYEFVLKGIPYYKLLIETGRKKIAKELIIKHSINYAKMINWFIYEENKQIENLYAVDTNLDSIYSYLEDYGYRYGIDLYENLIKDDK